MPSPTTTTKPGTRQAWTIACKEAGMDCSFSLTDHNQDELVNLVSTHLKNSHAGKTVPRADLLGLAKPSKW